MVEAYENNNFNDNDYNYIDNSFNKPVYNLPSTLTHLTFGSLFNLTNEFKKLPFKYFGTGEVTPDDLEVATAERIMAGIFKLS